MSLQLPSNSAQRVCGYVDGDARRPVVAWMDAASVVQWHDELRAAERRQGSPFDPRRVLTVENCSKWYGLHYIKIPVILGSVMMLGVDAVNPGVYSEADSVCVRKYGNQAYIGDHIYHPALFVEVARLLGLRVCEMSLNAVAGRWAMEYPNGYRDPWLMDAPGL